MQKITFRAMSCDMLAVVDRDDPPLDHELEQVPAWFEGWEQCLSRFRPDSELSQINLHSGEEVLVSPLMGEVLLAALQAAQESDGLVSPAMLASLEQAGYDRSFDQLQGRGAPQDLPLTGTADQNPREQESVESSRTWLESGSGPVTGGSLIPPVQLDQHNRMLRLSPGTRLDLSGIAKGWAADQAARRLALLGPSLVDAGGDIAVCGPRLSGEPWPVAIPDPFNPTENIDLLLLEQGGVATSGRDRRRWLKDGWWRHHIIDPRTGLPAQTEVLTATVLAPNAQTAEMAAKTALILGSWQGIAWLDARPELAGLLVLEDGERVHSRQWMNYIWR